MRVALIGCGVISHAYATNATAFGSFELVACADLDGQRAEELSAVSGLPVVAVAEAIADGSIDVILNLTPPSAHREVTAQALAAGKHVYSEKPLAFSAHDAAELTRTAQRLGVRIGCAPDIFLGSAYQAGRRAIDEGAIGQPLSVSAAMLVGGQETWHPNPDIFYADGAGPLFDMGPYYLTAMVALLGPIRRVAGFASARTVERTIEVGPRAGERFRASTPTPTTAALELAGGVSCTLIASFEAPGQYVCDIVIHGSEGVLRLPDPNAFGGTVQVKRGQGEWSAVRYASLGGADARGLGLAEMVDAIAAGRPHRASAELGTHVVDVARSILDAAASGRVVAIGSTVEQPAPWSRHADTSLLQ